MADGIDISDYDVENFCQQKATVYPYTFYVAFNSLWWQESDLKKPCPECGNKDVTHLGSFLSSDIWNNVFGCEKCEIAWCIWDQSGKITKKPEAVRNLVRALYDPDFTPNKGPATDGIWRRI